MKMPRRRARVRAAGRLAEPRAAEASYLRALKKAFRRYQAVIAHGLAPLLAVWPEPRADASDAELRKLWPTIDPSDIRRWAPWATSEDAVRRILNSGGRPIVGMPLEEYVRTSIASAKSAVTAAAPTSASILSTRPTGAFKVSHLLPAAAVAAPPVILGPNGRPIGPPPSPTVVTTETIRHQFDWVRLNLGRIITEEELSPILDATGKAVSRHTVSQLKRVLAIDLRAGVPGLQPLIDEWRGANVRLIESSILRPMDGVRLSPVLDDVSKLVEEAHANGLRVEELAGQIKDRFGVSDRRAELLARDQSLKLNAQINQHRQRSAGVTQYRWRTVGDERVRPMHSVLNGTVHSWEAPPEVAPGRNEHPGGDYQCRCAADPILPDWLEG